MTPNEMLALIRETVPEAYIGSTGGNCGAIIVDTPRGELLVTTDSGPWATPDDDDVDGGRHDWFVSLWGGDGSWLDGSGVRDGDTVHQSETVPSVVWWLRSIAV